MSKTVLSDLTHTKEEFQNSLKEMLDRDGKIEETLTKTEDLKVGTQRLKKTST